MKRRENIKVASRQLDYNTQEVKILQAFGAKFVIYLEIVALLVLQRQEKFGVNNLIFFNFSGSLYAAQLKNIKINVSCARFQFYAIKNKT